MFFINFLRMFAEKTMVQLFYRGQEKEYCIIVFLLFLEEIYSELRSNCLQNLLFTSSVGELTFVSFNLDLLHRKSLHQYTIISIPIVHCFIN
jgi:hypothetical protein